MHDPIDQAELDRAAAVIETLAARDHTTPDRVRYYLKEQIISGMLDPDPEVRKQWSSCPCQGEVPTPEEFLLWMADQVQGAL